jgi:glutamate formiminotransferase/glutamate formiminotransferase/formiminotetrahydrofolate cyclodeaminase
MNGGVFVPAPVPDQSNFAADVPDSPETLIAVPNVSEGRDEDVLVRVERGFAPALFLDIHCDPDHGRAVYTLAGPPGDLSDGLVSGAAAAIENIDLTAHDGLHPFVGALDVMPVVYRDDSQHGAACAEVLAAAGRIGAELDIPVILYGELATKPQHTERAWLRQGGWRRLAERIESGEVTPDFGPKRAHPTAGAMLAAARPPLVAFNLDLVDGDLELARSVAASIRESNGGLPGVRAIGLHLEERDCFQVSTNVHDYRVTPLRNVVDAVRALADVAEAELVGLAPEAAFQRFPDDLPIRGFSPERHLLENALRSIS